MDRKHFSQLESIENTFENTNTANGFFTHSEIPNLIESHSSKSVTITFIDPGGTVSHIVSEAKFGKESSDPQTTYLVIPTSAARDARYGGGSVTGCEDLNVDAIQGVQVDFADEGCFVSPEVNLPPIGNESEHSGAGSILVAGDIFSDCLESKGVHTIECFDNEEVLSKVCSKSTLNFRRSNQDCPDIEFSNDENQCEKLSKVIDNFGANIFCLVCAKTISSHIEAMLVSSSTMLSTRRAATTVLAKTLGDPLSEFTSPGCALCQACFHLLELVDTLEHRLNRATSLLLSRYWPKQQHSQSKQSSHPLKTTPRTGEQETNCSDGHTAGDDAPIKKCNVKWLDAPKQKKSCETFTLVSNPVLRRNEYSNVLKDLSQKKSSYSTVVSADQAGNEALATVKLAHSDDLDDDYEAETVIKIEERDNTEGEDDDAAELEGREEATGLGCRKRGRPRKSKKNCRALFRRVFVTPELLRRCPCCRLLFLERRALHRHLLAEHDHRKARVTCQICRQTFHSYGCDTMCARCKRNDLKASVQSIKARIARRGSVPAKSKDNDGGDPDDEGKVSPKKLSAVMDKKNSRCDLCGIKCSNNSSLYKHMKTDHPELFPHNCDICNAQFRYKTMLFMHLSMHIEGSLECPQCGIKFNKMYHLQDHLTACHADFTDFACSYCAHSVPSLDAFLTHLRVRHGSTLGLNLSVSCSDCDEKFHTGTALATHRGIYHPNTVSCPECGLRTTPSYLSVHVNAVHSKKKVHTCSDCDKTFFSRTGLTAHIKRHHRPRPFQCPECSKGYVNAAEMRRHIKAHRNERDFKCEFCSRTFMKQVDLTYHRRRHTGEKPHVCDICSEGFERPAALKLHVERHKNPRSNKRIKYSKKKIDELTSSALLHNDDIPSVSTSVVDRSTEDNSCSNPASLEMDVLASDIPDFSREELVPFESDLPMSVSSLEEPLMEEELGDQLLLDGMLVSTEEAGTEAEGSGEVQDDRQMKMLIVQLTDQ